MKQEDFNKDAVRVLIAGKPVWLDLENLKDDELCMRDVEDGSFETEEGEQHFNFKNAMLAAEKQGKRIPTRQERDFIRQLPHSWDEDRKGIWITFDLVEGGTIEMFFPAAGFRDLDSWSLEDVGTNGDYWSESPNSSTDNFSSFLGFYLGYIGEGSYDHQAAGKSVRCVKDQNK
jgi:hypothetical protein